jgi:hypothetical protein
MQHKMPSTSNQFEILNRLPNSQEVENPHHHDSKGSTKGKAKQISKPVVEQVIPSNSPAQGEVNLRTKDGKDLDMLVDERDLADIDLEKLEEAYNKKELQNLPLEQLYKVHKVYIDSTTRATSRSDSGLDIQIDLGKENRKTPKEGKRRGCKSAQQLIQEVGSFTINSGQIQKLTEGFFPPPPNPSQ